MIVTPDHQKGNIYMLWDIAYTKCYIGSTTETLARRMTKHRDKYRAWLRGEAGRSTLYEVFDEFGLENCRIYLLENYPCNNKEDLDAREGHH